MATKALPPIVAPFALNEAIEIDCPFQGQGLNTWQALVRNNTVYDLMVIAGASSTWLGPDEQDYYEFPPGISSFRLIPVNDESIPQFIFQGTIKVTAFDQSSGYDGVFPQSLAPPVILYFAGPQDQVGTNYTVGPSAMLDETLPLSTWMHTLFVFIVGTPGDASPSLLVQGAESGFTYFDADLSIVNDGAVLVAIPWVYAQDSSVHVEVTNNDGAASLAVALYEDSSIYPVKTVNGEEYTLVKIGTIYQAVLSASATAQQLTAVPANRGIKLQARSANSASVWWGFSDTITDTVGSDELSPGQAAVIPIQDAGNLWIYGTSGDGITVVVI